MGRRSETALEPGRPAALGEDADRIPHEWLLARAGADRPRALRVAAERLLRAHVRATVRQRWSAG
ncbi:hypothetical protein [Streptomyces sp. NBC_01727]|uniref:hypothetical protein n=1 Tax=Streptomyces sp. NBC_01727 TaxID=2975924 RepID=UPI002E161827|nr:hypothetical protein OIE76_08930 [Streptomyces sp. NBC_01727]